MNSSRMKNMIVLQNLPSNIIDEAFVILKNNKKIKISENLEKPNKINVNTNCSKEYIINEAEMLINNYVSQIEKDKYVKSSALKKIEKKYQKLKWITVIISGILILSFIF